MDKRQSEWRLLVLWCVGAVIVFVVLLIQHLNNTVGSDASRAWGWFTAAVVPTPMLLLGSFMSDAPTTSQIDPRAFRIVLTLSILYICLLVVASTRFMFQSASKAVDLLSDSALFLGPVQAAASLAFGRLFGTTQRT
jgi:hypothetical protein